MNTNNPLANNIDVQYGEEYSFRFTLSIDNNMVNAVAIFCKLKSIVEVVVESIKDEQISEKIFTETSKLYYSDLKIQYVFLSKDKACIEKYTTCFKEFNEILTQDAVTKNLSTDDKYVDLFKKIYFKNKLLDTLEVNPTPTSPKIKI